MWTVKMLRGPKPPMERTNANHHAAMERAFALLDLHSNAKITTIDMVKKLIVVDANEFYGAKTNG